MSDPAAHPAPPVRTVITTERRRTPLRVGIGLCIAAAVALAVGVIVSTVMEGAQVIGADGRADVGDSITFTAEAKEYDLIYLRGDSPDDAVRINVGRLRCEVVAADGTTRSIDGSSQLSSSETDLGASIGSFEVPAGPTTVECTATTPLSGFINRYAVAEGNSSELVLFVSLGVALLLAGIGAWLIVIGVRGRAVRITRPA